MATFTVPANAPSGGTVNVSDTVRNQGAGPAAPTITRFYLSLNSVLDASDVALSGHRAVPALLEGQTSTGATTLQLPAVDTGSYWVIAKADGDGSLAETLESNNTSARSLKVGPDLVLSLTAIMWA